MCDDVWEAPGGHSPLSVQPTRAAAPARRGPLGFMLGLQESYVVLSNRQSARTVVRLGGPRRLHRLSDAFFRGND